MAKEESVSMETISTRTILLDANNKEVNFKEEEPVDVKAVELFEEAKK